MARSQHILQNPPILRVLRKDGLHLCGICRAAYHHHTAAVSCLNRCWKQISEEGQGITLITDLGQEKYLCLFCFRSYRLPGEAQACAEDCCSKGIKKLQQLHLLPQGATEVRPKRIFQPLTAVSLRPAARQRRILGKPTAVADGTARDHETELADIKPTGGNADAAAGQAEGAVEQEKIAVNPTKAVKEHKKRHRDEFPKQFARANAKYMCLVCNTEYFTRAEVEACFNGHFDEQGYYIEKPAA